MTHATYAPRAPVHPDRTGPPKSGLNRLVVLHTSEGSESATSAEQLASLLARPGDKPSTSRPGGFYGASYHYILDTDQVIPAVPIGTVSYSAPGANNDGIHVVFPGRAGQTRDQWLDDVSGAMMKRCAELLVDLHQAGLGIPLRRVTVADVVTGTAGYCDHKTISDAYHRTDHWDVGPAFPWDHLADLIRDQLTPPPDQEVYDMTLARRYRDARYTNVWLIAPGLPVLHLSGRLDQEYSDVELVTDIHDQLLAQLLRESGVTRDELVPVTP